MTFKEIDSGTFFFYDEKLFEKVQKVYAGFNNNLMNALEVKTGRLWYINPKVKIEICKMTIDKNVKA